MPKTCVTFKNYDFPTEGTDEYPPGLEAAEFLVEELTGRGLEAKYDDFLDFYAHEIECRVGRRGFTITIGFAGEVDELVIMIAPTIPRFLRFFGVSSDAELLQLLRLLHEILTEHEFERVRWWTMKEWGGSRERWSASPDDDG